jgi:putative transcriptional regulator
MKKGYHYKECGLNNVWLVDGYRVRQTPYGESLSIENVDALYLTIARGLVEKSGPLSAKEIRFLRKHLGLSQRNLGALLGVNEETVSNWERTKSAMPPSADRLLRLYWLEERGRPMEAKVKTVAEFLREHDTSNHSLRLKRATGARAEWKLAA